MTQQVVPAWVYTYYKDGVVKQLQTDGYLLKGTAISGEVQANEVQWFTGGRMETEEIDRSVEEASTQNPARGNFKATFKDYAAAATVKIVDMNKIKPSELEDLKMAGASAIGRRSDWIQLDEMKRAADASEIETIGDGSADIDALDVMDAVDTVLGIGDTSVNNVFCALPRSGFSQLMMYKEFANAEWVGPDLPFTKMASAKRSWYGCSFFTLPDEYFTRAGGAKNSTYFDGYLWYGGGIGCEMNTPNLQTPITYLPTKRAWFLDNIIGGTAKVLQPSTVKRLRFKWRKPQRQPALTHSV